MLWGYIIIGNWVPSSGVADCDQNSFDDNTDTTHYFHWRDDLQEDASCESRAPRSTTFIYSCLWLWKAQPQLLFLSSEGRISKLLLLGNTLAANKSHTTVS